MQIRMWKKKNPFVPLVRMQIGVATAKSSFKNLKMELTALGTPLKQQQKKKNYKYNNKKQSNSFIINIFFSLMFYL